jgi:hypothetical protein
MRKKYHHAGEYCQLAEFAAVKRKKYEITNQI